MSEIDDMELGLRRKLWVNHGCSGSALYGSDGEMQCNTCGVDFKKESIEVIASKVLDQSRIRRIVKKATITVLEDLLGKIRLDVYKQKSLPIRNYVSHNVEHLIKETINKCLNP